LTVYEIFLVELHEYFTCEFAPELAKKVSRGKELLILAVICNGLVKGRKGGHCHDAVEYNLNLYKRIHQGYFKPTFKLKSLRLK